MSNHSTTVAAVAKHRNEQPQLPHGSAGEDGEPVGQDSEHANPVRQLGEDGYAQNEARIGTM
jgi:hypothetical protein